MLVPEGSRHSVFVTLGCTKRERSSLSLLQWLYVTTGCVDTVEETVKCNKTTHDTHKTTKDALYLTFFLVCLWTWRQACSHCWISTPQVTTRLSLFLMLRCIALLRTCRCLLLRSSKEGIRSHNNSPRETWYISYQRCGC